MGTAAFLFFLFLAMFWIGFACGAGFIVLFAEQAHDTHPAHRRDE